MLLADQFLTLYQIYSMIINVRSNKTTLKYFAENCIAFYGEYLCDLPNNIVNKYPVKYCQKSIE